ncbi:hypothetical protein [Rhodococcus koreensis]|uniref:hypothetical protein n=1 Tax=Rhodococcus koreensis TaxID=99653 RepID=UPI00366E47C2
MTSSSFYSDRVSGPIPQDQDELGDHTRSGLIAYIGTLVNKHWFAAEFPEECPDGNEICGTEKNGLGTAIEALIPGIEWPFRNAYGMADAQIFDLIEFAAARISKPSRSKFHSYYKHHELDFDRRAGVAEFRTDINQLLARGGANYELRTDGLIHRRGSGPVRHVVALLHPNTGDRELDESIQYATQLYMSRDPRQRQLALEKLWDGFEHLKTVTRAGDKKTSVAALLAKIEPDELRDHIEAEMLALTKIGNSFRLRHSEADKVSVPETARDYLFTRMGEVMMYLLQVNGWLNAEG